MQTLPNLSISNIAFSTHQACVDFVREHGIGLIDIAPTKAFDLSNWQQQVPDYLAELQDIKTVGMQSLMFGMPDNIFGSDDEQLNAYSRMLMLCKLARQIGVKHLTFGSPRNRIVPAEFTKGKAWREGFDIFEMYGDVAARYGVTISIEPNPASYGCNFLDNVSDCLDFCDMVCHPNVMCQLDTGELITNGLVGTDKCPLGKILDNQEYIGHVHVSAPNLDPIHEYQNEITRIFDSLPFLRDRICTIEMKYTETDNIIKSVEFAKSLLTKS